MSLFWTAVALTVVSVAYSYHMGQKAKKAAEKARREAEERADLAKGFQFTEEGQAKALPVVYGRNKVGGVRVHFKVTDGYNYAPVGSGGIVFESKKQPDNAQPIVYKLLNSSGDWSGAWSYVPSSVADFQSNPGWVTTRESSSEWKMPDRSYENDSLGYSAPGVDFVFVPFRYGNDTGTKPGASLSALGFSFPVREGTVEVLNSSQGGEKNEFYFVQQAICQGGLHAIFTADVDNKPYTYEPYSYGLRIHAYKNGSVVDPLMVANDGTRVNARFTKVAYATEVFKLNRDDSQYSGTPEVQFYVEGNEVYHVLRTGNLYTLSNQKSYTNNAALVLLDYLTNAEYGKGIDIADIS